MSEFFELNQKIEILRGKLNELLSDKNPVSKDRIIRYSRELDELIAKYHAIENMQGPTEPL
ncbi:MAG TPA: aspartyl-phosphate phosphatase Spo0E family protein [Clostridia bacterium]|nr:aspartyl-phosphate phosphatase Spo0E family protein [Clostridia bacterium]